MFAMTTSNYKIDNSEWLNEEDFVAMAYKLLKLTKLKNVKYYPCALQKRLERKGFKIKTL